MAKEKRSPFEVGVGMREGTPEITEARAVGGMEPPSSTARPMEVATGPWRREEE